MFRLAKPLTTLRLARHQSTAAKFLPNFSGMNGDSTLGELSERLYSKYRYRLVWPIVGWVGILYVMLWEDYTPKHEKEAQLARMKLLESLEFSQNLIESKSDYESN